ncbi:MAG: MBL fold metallo-hydrolase [Armatimonadetes bacterium]|nr:MBL fold metallo-hydrolase [Armatimonadota bacterium]
MQLILHGTGAGIPSAERCASALTATFSNGAVVLFDAGEGAAQAMLRDGVDLSHIITVAISHTHADHWCGLPGLLTALAVAKRKSPLTILAHPTALAFLQQSALHSHLFPERLSFAIEWKPLAPFALPDDWRCLPIPNTHLHQVEALAERAGVCPTAVSFLLEKNGVEAVYLSQDLGSEEDLRGKLKGCSLLVCESAHVNLQAVVEMAELAGVRRVVFTHIPPGLLTVPASTPAVQVIAATDGYSVQVE